jgi:hypothetical protein
LLTAAASSRASPEKDILRYNGVEKTKTASRNINLPHGILLQIFCDLEGFDVDKSFIVDTFNQTGKTSRELSKITYLLIALLRLAMIVYGESFRFPRPVIPRDRLLGNMFIWLCSFFWPGKTDKFAKRPAAANRA